MEKKVTFLTADEKRMEQAHSLQAKERVWCCTKYTSARLHLEKFLQEASLGRVSSSFALIQHLVTWADPSYQLQEPLYALLDFASMATRALHTILFQTTGN